MKYTYFYSFMAKTITRTKIQVDGPFNGVHHARTKIETKDHIRALEASLNRDKKENQICIITNIVLLSKGEDDD